MQNTRNYAWLLYYLGLHWSQDQPFFFYSRPSTLLNRLEYSWNTARRTLSCNESIIYYERKKCPRCRMWKTYAYLANKNYQQSWLKKKSFSILHWNNVRVCTSLFMIIIYIYNCKAISSIKITVNAFLIETFLITI